METTGRLDLTANEMLNTIFEYISKIAKEKNIEKTLMLLADMGRDMVIADRCTLWLLDRESNQLWTRIAHGLKPIRIPSDSGFVGHSVSSGQPLLIGDAYQDPRFNPEVDRSTGYRTKAILVIPIRNNQGEVMGAYQAVNKMTESERFSEQDLEHLTLAASYSARVIEAALLYQEIEETQKEIIFAMAKIGESRSRETGNHVKRVAEYSRLLAILSGMNEDEAELIRIASPMHDIGKVAIGDNILKKPGKLTDEEFTIMKRHTDIGYRLLRSSKRKLLQAASIIAEQHHEKWNGTGYPRGLMGEDIHIYARITAVADVFDALGSERSYKKAWELDRILTLFREERGRHFDPRLVDLFLEHIDEFLLIRDSYQDMPDDLDEFGVS